MTLLLAELAELVDGKLIGDGSVEIHGAATLATARPGEIAFLAGKFFQIRYPDTVVTPRALIGCELPRVDIVLNGLRRHPQNIGCLFRAH